MYQGLTDQVGGGQCTRGWSQPGGGDTLVPALEERRLGRAESGREPGSS